MTTMRKNPLQEETKRKLAQRRRILREGISDEAMKVLKEHFEIGLPVFLFADKQGIPLSGDPQMLTLMAARRDGQLHVIKWLEQERSRTPLEDSSTTTNN